MFRGKDQEGPSRFDCERAQLYAFKVNLQLIRALFIDEGGTQPCHGIRSGTEGITRLQPEPALVGKGDVDGIAFEDAVAGEGCLGYDGAPSAGWNGARWSG